MKHQDLSKRIAELTEDLEELKSSYTAGGNAKQCDHKAKVWQLLKKLNKELPYDPAMPLLGRDSRRIENKELMVAVVGWEGCKEGIVREFGVYMYTLLY